MKKFIFLLLLISSSVFASATIVETDDLQKVIDKVAELNKKFPINEILVVLDIDNTILTMNQDLGSDQWFNWQATGLKTTGFPFAVGKDFSELLKAQEKIYALSGMHPPQPNAPWLVADLQRKGFPVIVLTARGTDYRSFTERHLRENSFSFTSSAIEPKKGYPGTYLPYQLGRFEESGITAAEAQAFKLGDPREVSYVDGVFMGSGQHKGAMLRMLLKKTGAKVSAVVVADDSQKNVDAFQAAYANHPIELTAYRYSKVDPAVNKFNASNKTQVTSDWKRFNSTLKAVFAK